MSEKHILGDREKAMEDSYFRQQDAKLVESLRQKAPLDDIAAALAEQLQVDNPDLLNRVRQLGINADNVSAFFAAPLVQVAWAEGRVSKGERETVLRLARQRGIDAVSPAYAQLVDWLATCPSDELFETAVEVLRHGFGVLPPAERDERIQGVMNACHEVAEASGSQIARLIGLGDGVSGTEASLLDSINRKLRLR